MNRIIPIALALGFLAAGAVAGPGNGHGKGRPGKGRSELLPPVGAADLDAAGRVEVKHFGAVGRREERSWLRLKLKRMDANAALTIWADDPATDADPTLVQVGTEAVATNDEGHLNFRIDTKHGGTLPFGSTLALLAGKAIELRDAAGAVVLAGVLPAAD